MPRSPHPRRRATLASLAAELNVSRTTISNAYNRPDQLSAELRDRVLAAAKRLGYTGPDPVARSLRTRRAGAVGLVITEPLTYAFSDPAALEFVAGLAETCEEAGQGLLLVSVGPDRGGRSVEAVNSAGVDGFVVYAPAADDPCLRAAIDRRVPVVVVDQPRDLPGVSWVGIDDYAAMRELADHVVGLGHTEIAVISMRLGDRSCDCPAQRVAPERLRATEFHAQADRVAGVRDAMTATGLDPETLVLVEACRHDAASAAAAVEIALRTNPRVTAIMCTADVLAVWVMDFLRGRGIYVPGQLTITGFDGIPEALNRGLTTVAQPNLEKGRRAGGLLHDPPRSGQPVRDVLPTELVRGRTSGPPTG